MVPVIRTIVFRSILGSLYFEKLPYGDCKEIREILSHAKPGSRFRAAAYNVRHDPPSRTCSMEMLRVLLPPHQARSLIRDVPSTTRLNSLIKEGYIKEYIGEY